MPTLGKVLIFLNVLAAGAIAYFAADNWARRQTLNATGLRYAITLRGMPTTPADGDPASLTTAPADDASVAIRLPTGTGRYTTDVPYSLLKSHFSGADGKAAFGSNIPPLSVIGEVQRAKAALDTFLRNQGGDEGELAWLCGREDATGYTPGYLTLLADSFGERQVIRRLLDFPNVAPGGRADEVKASLAVARDILKKRFDAVLNSPNPAVADADAQALANAQKAVTAASDALNLAHGRELQTRAMLKDSPEDAAKTAQLTRAALETKDARDKLAAEFKSLERVMAEAGLAASRDPVDRRRRALQLLMHLDHKDPDAGWQKRMILLFGQPDYAEAQLDRVERLKPYPNFLADEQSAADAQFLAQYEQMKQAARDRDRILDRQLELLAEAKTQVDDAKKLLTQRTTYRDERVAVAKNLSDQLAALAAEQEKVEATLFDIQTRVGQLLRDNFTLEDKLILAERQAKPPTGR